GRVPDLAPAERRAAAVHPRALRRHLQLDREVEHDGPRRHLRKHRRQQGMEMKKLLLLAAALTLSACSSMPSWMPGGGWTTLVDGDKGLDNFSRVGDANWRGEDGAVVADRARENSYLVSK